MPEPNHHFAWTADGLRLHALAWEGDGSRPVILGLPGLTRNARDFLPLAKGLGGRARLVATSLRGRGLSGWAADPMTYALPTYISDTLALMDGLGLDKVLVAGTSLGAIVGLGLAATAPGRVAGLILNDLGPELPEAGIARVRAQVGEGPGWHEGWASARAAAEAIRLRDGAIYPGWTLADWEAHAGRLSVTLPSGWLRFDCDPGIATPFADAPAGPEPDLWRLFDQATEGLPVVSVRGAISDILTADCQARMAARHPCLRAVTVADVGHAPCLDEAEAIAAIADVIADLC
ncbi:MAG: alpha/beta fold hydrolase [Thermaurantiacus sp.]